MNHEQTNNNLPKPAYAPSICHAAISRIKVYDKAELQQDETWYETFVAPGGILKYPSPRGATSVCVSGV